MTRSFPRPLLAAGALVLAALAAAPGSARADDPPAADDLVLDVSKDMRVSDLLTTASKALGRPILWQTGDQAVTGRKISGAEGGTLRIAKRKVLSALRALLVPQEVLLLPLPVGEGTAWFAMDARALASQFLLRIHPEAVEVTEANAADLAREEGLFVVATIPVSNVDNLRDASTALRRLVTQNNIGAVQEVPDARVFVVSDFAPNVVQIWRTIRAMDAGAAKRRPRAETLPLRQARAERVAPLLEQLVGSQRPVTGLEALGARARVAADPATNSLLVVATPDDLEVLKAAVEKLDVPEKTPEKAPERR
jgi:type II secretory pathway component GspD/PulD (secretin)